MVEMTVGNGAFLRAGLQKGITMIYLATNAMHTEFVTRCTDKWLQKAMGTEGHPLYEATMSADLKRLYAELFKEDSKPSETQPQQDPLDDVLQFAF